MKSTVVHCRKSKFDVYIGRPSKWGNPFKLGQDGDRTTVLEKYREWLKQQDELLDEIQELKGKILSCWCKPDSCHGDILAELANSRRATQLSAKEQRKVRRPTGANKKSSAG
jgi:hypothetical protein